MCSSLDFSRYHGPSTDASVRKRRRMEEKEDTKRPNKRANLNTASVPAPAARDAVRLHFHSPLAPFPSLFMPCPHFLLALTPLLRYGRQHCGAAARPDPQRVHAAHNAIRGCPPPSVWRGPRHL